MANYGAPPCIILYLYTWVNYKNNKNLNSSQVGITLLILQMSATGLEQKCRLRINSTSSPGKNCRASQLRDRLRLCFARFVLGNSLHFSTSQAPSVNYFKKRPTPKIDFKLPVGFHPSIRKGNGTRQLSWWISWTDVGKIPGSHLMSLMTIGDFLTWRDVIKHEPKTISIIHDQS